MVCMMADCIMDDEYNFAFFPLGYYFNNMCENSHESCITCISCTCMMPAVWCDIFTLIPRCLCFSSIKIADKCCQLINKVREPIIREPIIRK